MPPDLLHLIGYLTGATLYAMLGVMARRDASSDRLTVGAAMLGLAWNTGELAGHGLGAMTWLGAQRWVMAASFAAFGGLAAVVIHSVARGTREDGAETPRWRQRLPAVGYAVAGISGGLQLWSAATGQPVPNGSALVLLTGVLVALALVLVIATRRQPQGRRATWMTALAVFAISALHLTNFHGPSESWTTELVGHQSSIPLAFAILYQDYRFALADLFLKQALTIVLIVGMVFALWSVAGPALVRSAGSPEAIGVLLGLWVLSTFAFPVIRRAVNTFVDRVVLHRVDYPRVVERITAAIQDAVHEPDLLNRACAHLAPALSASQVGWEVLAAPEAGATASGRTRASERPSVVVPTHDSPNYRLRIGRLAGGRRLLSGDVTMLEQVAAAVGRRLDMLRLADERLERTLREREIQSLVTEAELKALRAQINPHFLFNALTTIGYLVETAPERAVTTLLKLTTLLRGALRTDGEFTTLRREMELVSCYLDIERERFESRLEIAIEVPDTLADYPIPALVLQPLVENAVKHGVAPSRSGGRVTVRATLDDTGRLCLTVRNTGVPLDRRRPAPREGIGLANVERRLQRYYGPAGAMTLTSTAEGGTVAEIRIPVVVSAAVTAGAGGGRPS